MIGVLIEVTQYQLRSIHDFPRILVLGVHVLDMMYHLPSCEILPGSQRGVSRSPQLTKGSHPVKKSCSYLDFVQVGGGGGGGGKIK